MDVPTGYLATAIALLAAIPVTVMIVQRELWLALGTFVCIAVIGVCFWYLFDGGEPDSHAVNQ